MSTKSVANNSENNKKPGGCTGKGFVKDDPRINRSGRPTKKPITEAYEKLLQDPETAREVAQAMLDVIKSRGKGTVFAAKEMADRVEGPVTNKLELSGEISLADRLAKARKNAADLRAGSRTA